MNTIRTDAGEFDLEDARITSIQRLPTAIHLSFSSALLKSPAGDVTEHEDVRASLVGVSGEQITTHLAAGQRTAGDPTYPLDVVEVVKYEPGLLTLEGYRKQVPWHVWSVPFQELTIEYAGGRRAHAI